MICHKYYSVEYETKSFFWHTHHILLSKLVVKVFLKLNACITNPNEGSIM
jgi:hypothetical protein